MYRPHSESLIFESDYNMTRQYIRTPHNPLSLQHDIPSQAQTHNIYLPTHNRSVLSSNASIFPAIIHCSHIPIHPHLPLRHHRSIPLAAPHRPHIPFAPWPRRSTIHKPEPASHTQSQNFPRTPRLPQHGPCRRYSLG